MFLIFIILIIFSFKCFEFTNNNNNCILKINDLLSEDYLQFRNVQVKSFDSQKRPVCDDKNKLATIHLPGWLKLISGEVVINKLLPSLGNLNKTLELSLTLEQDSFFVGKICDRGQSQSSFISDEFCSPFFCHLLPNACKILLKAKIDQIIPLSNFFPFDGWLPLEDPLAHPILSGLWKAEAELLLFNEKTEEEEEGKLLAKIGNEGWVLIRESDDWQQKEHEDL
uniref:Uncharacterized protein n=1 Tax=Meloidogyne enterolobii TaxID=390850 RepID=A0A6V7V7E9_MELEN|nr:unnamed protein product [Meloidogyne enterolobii]